jgi:hypothetical protein
MLNLHMVFKDNYIVPNFSYGMLWYVTISTSSWYASLIGLKEENKDDDNYNDDDNDDRMKMLVRALDVNWRGETYGMTKTCCFVQEQHDINNREVSKFIK